MSIKFPVKSGRATPSRFSSVGKSALTHRYSESTSSNPGNLTFATVRGGQDWQQAGPPRGLAHVAPVVDLGECTLHLPPQCE